MLIKRYVCKFELFGRQNYAVKSITCEQALKKLRTRQKHENSGLNEAIIVYIVRERTY